MAIDHPTICRDYRDLALEAQADDGTVLRESTEAYRVIAQAALTRLSEQTVVLERLTARCRDQQRQIAALMGLPWERVV